MRTRLFRCLRLLTSALGLVLLLSACARDIPLFTPPAERAPIEAEQPWAKNSFLALAYHDVVDRNPDQTFVAITTDHLKEQFAWLYANGYQPVSVEQILASRRGGESLPERAVLLTFDDGYRSFYTRVYPVLKAYRWPAVLAPVGNWLDTPRDQSVNFGGTPTPRDKFLYWQQVREMVRSGLVEIGAHTDNLHHGAVANPQGNQEPAAAARRYDIALKSYESEADYRTRIEQDVRMISGKIMRATGTKPRVWVWPYGAASGPALKIVGDHGYDIAMTLQDGAGTVNTLMNTPRMLVANDPPLREYASAVINMRNHPLMRVAHVDLDYVYDDDPAQMERNLGELVQRIADMRITHVFLQAFADPEGDGLIKALYFPNRHLPMRSELFNRAAWQLMSRASVKVYAWLPVLSFDLDPAFARVQRWDPATGQINVDAQQYRRLSPFDPRARQQIIDIYEDLSSHAMFDGILFHDDALLSDFEDVGPQALAAYRAAGLPDNIAALRADPAMQQRWTRFKSKALTDLTLELANHVKAIRGPQIKTARNIFAMPIIEPESEAWFAQNLDDFLAAYDWTAPMAMPYMENVPAGEENAWLDRLVDAVASRPGALNRTVFEIQARDWRPNAKGRERGAIDSAVMARWLKRLQLRGARNLGYYPDDFVENHPRLDVIRPAISNSWYPQE